MPIIDEGKLRIFADWTAIISANVCLDQGYDVYLENPCDFANRKHVYGNLLLFMPFIEKFPNFYYIYLPFIFCFLIPCVLLYLVKDAQRPGTGGGNTVRSTNGGGGPGYQPVATDET